MSTDATVSIANSFGAKVTSNAFKGYASQRNFGLALPFMHPWVLVVDADERIPAALVSEIRSLVASAPSTVTAGRMRRRDIWMGKWLKHTQISPYFIRLLKVGRCHYEREINEILITDGKILNLEATFDHYPFSKGIDHWISKHNSYSKMEAERIAAGLDTIFSIKSAFTHPDFNERRKHQKIFFYKLPFSPLIKFAYMLIWRRGVLDGSAGLNYALLQAIYEYFIVLKTKEIIHRARNTHD
jgi:glycosyltransferase involved in cell wall biosynthesis